MAATRTGSAPSCRPLFDDFSCDQVDEAEANIAPADEPLVTCDDTGTVKYLLGPVEVDGSSITDAFAAQVQGSGGVNTGQWGVNIRFTGDGGQAFKDIGTRLISLPEPRNQFGAVLDGRVITAPRVEGVTDAPTITGTSRRRPQRPWPISSSSARSP